MSGIYKLCCNSIRKSLDCGIPITHNLGRDPRLYHNHNYCGKDRQNFLFALNLPILAHRPSSSYLCTCTIMSVTFIIPHNDQIWGLYILHWLLWCSFVLCQSNIGYFRIATLDIKSTAKHRAVILLHVQSSICSIRCCLCNYNVFAHGKCVTII